MSCEMPLKFVTSTRGRPMLCVGGFVFRKDRSTLDKTTWRCEEETCRARISTADGTHSDPPEHMHAPDSVGIDVRERLDCLRKSAVQKTYAKSTALVAAAVSEVSSRSTLGSLPRPDLLRRQVLRARKREYSPMHPTNPLRREDLVIPDFLKMTTKGDPFLLYDSGEGDCERMIIFATPDNLELLKTCGEWFLDGTFKVCPLIFHQMYSVLVKISGSHKTVPVVDSLMPGKTSRTYRRFLTILTSFLDDFRPESLWRHIQADATLRDKYLRENDFSLDVRMFAAIAFVPLGNVQTAFETLLESEFVRENNYILTNFINYFENTWIGRPRNPALMKPQWWNVHEATLSGQGRTSNEIEGWHAAFAGRVGVSHPTFFKLTEQLRFEQALTEYAVINFRANGSETQPKKKYRDRQKRLLKLTSSFDIRRTMQFLNSVAGNISF
ncbi:uncharacterized protein LOC100900068 [Galendromus occidentalis]|uniref:Uncharacterized protein LOC100900068 n=1 Tax=Galendromus occidentalis TaxID=34638 RepID=A0AAJ7PA30_9ACAR|nr:uncharacterized protein LOC100900068 [Galendromus occidentalis]